MSGGQPLRDLFCSVFHGESKGERQRRESNRDREWERARKKEGRSASPRWPTRYGGEHASEHQGHVARVPYDWPATMPFLKMFQQPSPWLKQRSSSSASSLSIWWLLQPIAPCFRATWVLQLWLKEFGLNPNGLRDINPQSRVLANGKLKKFSPRLGRFLDPKNSIWFNLGVPNWLGSRLK